MPDIGIDDLNAAKDRLHGNVHVTPIITSRLLNERTGCEVLLKCENFQRVGAFKFRGAFNAISNLSAAELKNGIVTHSSGNHAQAVALVGKLLNIETTVVMPNNAPAIKRAATKAYGATIVDYDPEAGSREEISDNLVEKYGYTLIPPFDHPDVIAGQGTVAMELIEQTKEFDALLTPVGGGGLLSGCAIATKHLLPSCKVIGIEPELADDAKRSFYSGTLQSVHNPDTIADGTRVSSLGQLTFPLIQQYVDDIHTVSEHAIMEAVKFAFYHLKLVIEPSGSLGIAALLEGSLDVAGRVAVVISGGNIDAPTMTKILNSDS